MPIYYPNLITELDAEISCLQQARKLLSENSTSTGTRKRKFTMSAGARAKIASAQRKRWALGITVFQKGRQAEPVGWLKPANLDITTLLSVGLRMTP